MIPGRTPTSLARAASHRTLDCRTVCTRAFLISMLICGSCADRPAREITTADEGNLAPRSEPIAIDQKNDLAAEVEISPPPISRRNNNDDSLAPRRPTPNRENSRATPRATRSSGRARG